MKKTVMITGASRGIGRALCQEALKRQYRVIAVVRTPKSSLPGCEEKIADAADRSSMAALIEAHASEVDVFIANAGINKAFDPQNKNSIQPCLELLDLNVTATSFAMLAMANAWASMKLRERTLAVVSSLAAGRGIPGFGVYAASKTAEMVLAQGLDFDLEGTGINVCIIRPGFVDTDMTKRHKDRPFLWKADRAAAFVWNGLEKNKLFIAFPIPMRIGAFIRDFSPYFLFRFIAKLSVKIVRQKK